MECLASHLLKNAASVQCNQSALKPGLPVYAELKQLWQRLVCDTFIDPIKRAIPETYPLNVYLFSFVVHSSVTSPWALQGNRDSLGADIPSVPGDQRLCRAQPP